VTGYRTARRPTRRMNSLTLCLVSGSSGAFVVVGALLTSPAPVANGEPDPTPAPIVEIDAPRGLSATPPVEVIPEGGSGAAGAACAKFSEALALASLSYDGFADVTSGDHWSYSDPTVSSANAIGRTALREAAAAVLSASSTPGLQPDLVSPMRGWSMRAAKLIVIMGVHGDTDRTNTAADQLNQDTYDTQMACANATG
jgi:hypothetical protein